MALNIHAGLVRIGGHGVLVLGGAGTGKSSLLVSLIRAGTREGLDAALVADDRVELRSCGGRPLGRAPAAIRGLIELRGVGIVRLPAMESAPIDLVVELQDDPDRMPDETETELAGHPVRRIVAPSRQASFVADLVLTLLGADAGSVDHTVR